MGFTSFSEDIAMLIADESKRVCYMDAYIGENVHSISMHKAEPDKDKNVFYVLASNNNELLCIETLRKDLDKFSAERMIKDLTKRINSYVKTLDSACIVEAVMTSEDVSEALKQPVLVKVCAVPGTFKDDKNKKSLCAEINDWLEELNVMISSNSTAKQIEDYQQEYEKIVSTNFIPHDDSSAQKDFSKTMCVISLISAIASIFFYDLCIFPVITVVASGFSAYRCYKNDNKVALAICAVCFVIGCVFTYFGWQELSKSIVIKN